LSYCYFITFKDSSTPKAAKRFGADQTKQPTVANRKKKNYGRLRLATVGYGWLFGLVCSKPLGCFESVFFSEAKQIEERK